ncbi:MAG: MBL fold metallo-hydrolase [Chloroflexi bacterium]|nr:MBL fold metallo-hydrolase [Chloroflexota bacterium]
MKMPSRSTPFAFLLRRWRLFLPALLALLLFVGAACGGRASDSTLAPPSRLEVHFVDVGQGDGMYIRTPQGQVMVVDGGGRSSGLSDFLDRHGVKNIDIVVGTNPDADHIGGLIEVLRRFTVQEVWVDGQINTTRAYEDFLSAAQRSRAVYREVRRGDTATLGAVAVRVLHPVEPFIPGDRNQNSVVLKIEYGQTSILLTGDTGVAAERSMLQAGLDVRAQVLKLGHHGSSTSTSPAFLQAVAPQVAVYQAGRDNQYGHPHPEVVEAVRSRGIALYGTNTNGTIVLRSDGASYTVTTER